MNAPSSDLNSPPPPPQRSGEHEAETWFFRTPAPAAAAADKEKNLLWDFLLASGDDDDANDAEFPTKKIQISDLFEGPGKHKIKSIIVTVLKSTKKTIANLNSSQRQEMEPNSTTTEKQFRSDLHDSVESLRILLAAAQDIFKASNQVSNVLKNITEQQCNFLSSIMTLTCEMNKGYAPFFKLGPIGPSLYKWKSEESKQTSAPPPPPPPQQQHQKPKDPTSKWSFRRRDAHLQAEKSERLWDFLCDYRNSDCKRLLADIQFHRKRLQETNQMYHKLNAVDEAHPKIFLIASAFKSAKKIIMYPNQTTIPKNKLKDDFILLLSNLSKLGSALQEIIEATDTTAASLEAIYKRHCIFLSNIMNLTNEMNLRYGAYWDLGSLAPGRPGWRHRETDKGVMRRNVPADF